MWMSRKGDGKGMDDLLELILEIILEGAAAAADSRRVPLPVRILLAALMILFFGGIAGLLIWTGIGSGNGILAVLGGLLLAWIAGVVFVRVKRIRKRR